MLGFTIGGGIVVGIVVTVIEPSLYNPIQYNPNPLGSAEREHRRAADRRRCSCRSCRRS